MWNDPNSQQVYDLWADAADLDSDTRNLLFQVSHQVCLAYAPPLAEGAPVPPNYLVAEIMQARHTWGQLRGGNQNSFGPEGYEIQVYPLVFAARDLLRPKTSPLGRLR